MTTTIYARIRLDVKVKVAEYANAHGMTLARAVSNLLELGLAVQIAQPSVEERLGLIESTLGITW